jgi:hypothetical protein
MFTFQCQNKGIMRVTTIPISRPPGWPRRNDIGFTRPPPSPTLLLYVQHMKTWNSSLSLSLSLWSLYIPDPETKITHKQLVGVAEGSGSGAEAVLPGQAKPSPATSTANHHHLETVMATKYFTSRISMFFTLKSFKSNPF